MANDVLKNAGQYSELVANAGTAFASSNLKAASASLSEAIFFNDAR